MALFVDPLAAYGWVLRGHKIANCHLFTDSTDLDELHRFAVNLGMKQSWFQDHHIAPHYDLTPRRRALAVRLGAIEVTRRQAVTIWRLRRMNASPHHGHP